LVRATTFTEVRTRQVKEEDKSRWNPFVISAHNLPPLLASGAYGFTVFTAE